MQKYYEKENTLRRNATTRKRQQQRKRPTIQLEKIKQEILAEEGRLSRYRNRIQQYKQTDHCKITK